MKKGVLTFCTCMALVTTLLSGSSQAGSLAVFGDNSIDNLINGGGSHTATLVSDAQLATPGFLSSFDAFLYTRNGSSFGTGLSAAAAANVAAFVGLTGNIVLLNADFADGAFGASFEAGLIENAVDFAIASGNGFIGEFNGAVAALTSNSNGFTPLGLIAGSAGGLGQGAGGSSGSISLTGFGIGHSVTSGLTFPNNPGSVEFGATITGVAAPLVLATFDNGNPAIIVRGASVGAVPEPTTLALMGLGFAGLGIARRRRAAASK